MRTVPLCRSRMFFLLVQNRNCYCQRWFLVNFLLFTFYSLQFIFCCFRSVLHYLVDMYVVWTSYILLLFITYYLLFLLFDNYLCSILIVYCCVFYCIYYPTIFYFFFHLLFFSLFLLVGNRGRIVRT